MNKLFLSLASAFIYVALISNINAQTTAPTAATTQPAKPASTEEKHHFKKSDKDSDKDNDANKSGDRHDKKDNPNWNKRASEIEKNPACQKIVNECKKLGFIVGEYREDNGLWKDCFHPTLSGKPVTQRGKAISVPVKAEEIAACKETVGKKHGEHKRDKDGKSAVKSKDNSTSPAVK